MTGTLAPSPVFTGLDDDGNVISNGLLYTYLAGTTTPADTFTDVGLSVPNSNPIVLNSAGRCVIFLDALSYKFILKKADGSLVWSQDNIASVGAVSGEVQGDQFFFGGDPTSPVTDTAYPSGATYDKLHAGSSIYRVDSAVLIGTFVIEAMMLCLVNTITLALVDLDDGAPDTPLVILSATNSAGSRVQSGSITFAAPGVAKNYGIKAKVDAGSGYAWGIRLVRTT